MNIFTNLNIKILDLISRKEAHIREIAEIINCSPAKVHSAVALFKKYNLIKQNKIKNKIVIIPNRDAILYQKVKALINLNKLLNSQTIKKLKKIAKIGVYGSFAQGTDDEKSDVDVYLYTKKPSLELMDYKRKLEKELDKQVNFLVLNQKKLNSIKNSDKPFYIRLKLKSIALNGGIFE